MSRPLLKPSDFSRAWRVCVTAQFVHRVLFEQLVFELDFDTRSSSIGNAVYPRKPFIQFLSFAILLGLAASSSFRIIWE